MVQTQPFGPRLKWVKIAGQGPNALDFHRAPPRTSTTAPTHGEDIRPAGEQLAEKRNLLRRRRCGSYTRFSGCIGL